MTTRDFKLQLQLALTSNENLMKILATKWHGNTVKIAKDINLMTSVLLHETNSESKNSEIVFEDLDM